MGLFRVNEIHKIQKSWQWVKLDEAVDVFDNLRKPINSEEREKRIIGKKTEDLFPYYGATGQVGWIDEFITNGEYVLVGEDGAPFLDLYKEKAYIIRGKTWVNNHAHILQGKAGVTLNAFLLNYLNHFNYNGFVNGTTRFKLTKGRLLDIPIPLPPFLEQRAIVSKIEQLFSELDKGIESLKTAQQQLEMFRQSVLKWAFDKSIGAESVPVVRLEQVCEFITKGTTPSKDKLYFQSGEIPFIKVYNLTFNGSLDFSIAPTFISKETHGGFLSRSKVIPGDVLMNIVGPPLGKVSIVPNIFSEWNINQAIVRFRCRESLLKKYLAHYLLSATTINRYSKKAKATAGQFNLTLEICRDIKIPLPSVTEQHKIVQVIESRLSECDNMEATITASLLQAEALRQSILKKAFEGRLLNDKELEAVRQDPTWEPAERLLERILAEKAVLHSEKKGRKSKSGVK